MTKSILVAALAGALACAREPRVGNAYTDLESLTRDFPHYSVVGVIREDWPAQVVRIERGQDSLAFDLRGGQSQLYRGFDGYRLRAVILVRSDRTEMGVVFRSDEHD